MRRREAVWTLIESNRRQTIVAAAQPLNTTPALLIVAGLFVWLPMAAVAAGCPNPLPEAPTAEEQKGCLAEVNTLHSDVIELGKEVHELRSEIEQLNVRILKTEGTTSDPRQIAIRRWDWPCPDNFNAEGIQGLLYAWGKDLGKVSGLTTINEHPVLASGPNPEWGVMHVKFCVGR